MEDFSALSAGERKLLQALHLSDLKIGEAVRDADGIWISGSFGMRPPPIGGDAVGDRLDVVTHMHGLAAFDVEISGARDVEIDGIPLKVLPLERIIASKRASNRAKDLAAIPALEEALAALSDIAELESR